ncbi:hypothetical protein D9613_011606 [Agrocybe pediades]|uniref:Uncharacterized protein n=1 Tax=Agrocybe pediades TaxID=84607 RepID=A0A8H4QXP3_9AGAR|nr:hypothetical protein D9613_011606 [Agrocybe pediades]
MKFAYAFTILFALALGAHAQTFDPSLVPGWNEVCGTIAGTTPCSNPLLQCCYLYPDYGVLVQAELRMSKDMSKGVGDGNPGLMDGTEYEVDKKKKIMYFREAVIAVKVCSKKHLFVNLSACELSVDV